MNVSESHVIFWLEFVKLLLDCHVFCRFCSSLMVRTYHMYKDFGLGSFLEWKGGG